MRPSPDHISRRRRAATVLVVLALCAALLHGPRPAPPAGAQVLGCPGSPVVNGTFLAGNIPGTMPPAGAAGWTRGYGSPQVFDEPGCDDRGFVRMRGSKSGGSAVAQALNPSNKLRQGKKYVLTACVRSVSPGFPQFRAVAFNGALPQTGTHPAPGPALAVIGRSGPINSSGWTRISLPVWAAGKDYDHIALSVEGPDDTKPYAGDIDNVCIREAAGESCDEAELSPDGQVVLPPELDPDAPPVYEDVNEYNGSTADLYGGQCNTQLDTWYQDCEPPCPSVGGGPPPETGDQCTEELAAMGLESVSCEGVQAELSKFKLPPTKQAILPPIPGPDPPSCRNVPRPDRTQPFGGADIVFVHGLKLEHLCDRANQDPGALRNWPAAPTEFYSGYYKARAEKTWESHIRHFLTDRGHKNRYLVVSYNNSQRLKVAAHAVLSQIREAMLNGRGVVAPRGVGRECFGQRMVIISHSTGALVTDVALSIAQQTKFLPPVRAEFGRVGYIADRTRAHVSLHGAISGSHLATALVGASYSNSASLSALADLVVTRMVCKRKFADITHIVKNSVLLDLIPQVAQGPPPHGWRAHVSTVPVPVLTTAGGHPGGTLEWSPIVKQGLHRGLDDGVLTMDSQCGNPTPASAWPSRVTALNPLYKLRLFDLGVPAARAAGYFVDQTYHLPTLNYAAGCIPFVAPDGMRTPNGVPHPAANPLRRYPNHCSFIQTASGHYAGPRGLEADAYGTGANYAPPGYPYEPTFGTANNEEVRAFTCPSLYSSGLVNPAMRNMVGEYTRGRRVTFTLRLFGKRWTRTKWIWKRTYYLLDGYETKTEVDYVYDHVLRP